MKIFERTHVGRRITVGMPTTVSQVSAALRFASIARLLCAALLILAGCDRSPAPSSGGAASGTQPLKVLATTSMIADAVRSIGGPRVEVDTLMGPGVDPHLYQPTARDPLRLRGADLVLHHGLFLEGRLGEALVAAGGKTRVVAVSKDIAPDRLLKHGAGEHAVDPHVWLDAMLWRDCVRVVGQALAEADPAHAAAHRTATDAVLESMAKLDAECRATLAKIPKERRVLVTSHDAFGYFGRAYDVEVVGIQGLSTETEAGLKRITDTVDLIRERGIRGVFPETSVPKAAIERVSRDSGAKLGEELYSDSLAAPDESAGTYAGMMRENVRRIVAGLGGD
jgi:manganese/zinc/iron transport system substrate-binding protein